MNVKLNSGNSNLEEGSVNGPLKFSTKKTQLLVRAMGMVCLLTSFTLGNTYYIDYTGGQDANSGTSKSAPWKRCPGMNGFGAAYIHSPGDVYLFKGGEVWPAATLPLTISNSGSPGHPDNYSTDHSWFVGTSWGQPTFDGGLFQNSLLVASEKSNFRINDLKFINAGMAAANGIIAFKFSNCSSLEISNNTLAPQSWGALYILTERPGDFNDIFIHHNDISACAFGMRFVPGAAGSIMHNVLVYNNNIHDFKSQLSGQVHGDGIQYYNTPDVAASYDRYIEGFKIFNNHFYGDFRQTPGSGGAMTALIYLSGAAQGVEIYNNLFAPEYSGSQSPNFFESFISLRDNPNRGGHHKIYSNTFVTPVAGGQGAAILEDDTRYPSPALDIKNNIFSNFNWPYDLRSTNHTIDYNNVDYVRDVGKWAGNFVGSLTNWQALGLDVHGFSANAGFVSPTDFHLNSSSPCIGKGADVSSVVTTDFDGNSRPGPQGFSIGAYEFGSTHPISLPSPATIKSWWPGNAAAGVVINPSLTWSADSEAQSYSVQVSRVPGFESLVINQTGITSNTYDAPGLSINTLYYWRVNSTKGSITTDWTIPWTFTTVAPLPSPTLTLWWPSNEATGVVMDPTLTWSEEPGMLSYALQVSTDSGFSKTIINQSGITKNSLDATGLAYATLYFWRVNVTTAGGTTGWSPASKFTLIKPPKTASVQDSGADGLVVIEAENFTASIAQNGHSWERVLNAGYSGESAMQALPNNGTIIDTGYGLKSPRMDYRVLFVKPGKQFIWVRGIGASGSDDSYHAGIDGNETGTCKRISFFTPQWTWSKTTMEGQAAYFTISEAGEHIVNIWMREDGFIIDKIVITTNPNYTPTGTGPQVPLDQAMMKKAVPATAVRIHSGSPVLDVYSYKNGSVLFSLPKSGAYQLAVYSLGGKKAITTIENTGSTGYNIVSLPDAQMHQGNYFMRLSMNGLNVNRNIFLIK